LSTLLLPQFSKRGTHFLDDNVWLLESCEMAAVLGIPRSTLEWKIRALKIDKSRFRTLATKSS
jgi:hypothetical protein